MDLIDRLRTYASTRKGELAELITEAADALERQTCEDAVSRQAAIDALKGLPTWWADGGGYYGGAQPPMVALLDPEDAVSAIENLPSAQPFHNITMGEVLKYIDDMPEDVWQEFTACLECRGWELQKRTAKWCGGDFA